MNKRTIIALMAFCYIGLFCILSVNLHAENRPDKKYTLGPEDVLDIRVWDNDDLNRIVEVSQDGEFTFPLIGRVQASGLSVFELENLIKKRLGDGYLIAPQVTIVVVESRSQKVYILGEVNRPGSYPIKGSIHVLELISQAGGLTDSAGRIVTIVRPKPSSQRSNSSLVKEGRENEIITLDLGKFDARNMLNTFFVTTGDTIHVDPVPRIFVTGEVINPGELKWEKGLTVRRAISLAGGPTEKASPGRVIIVRMKNGKEKEFKSKMDEFVMPDDIIKVPGRYF
ncbi:MAG: hypothetical protein E3K32_09770 [wastewater metagenome]|nr:hypothetical protein [Candidatus Loosdrechtia aerotolerans]